MSSLIQDVASVDRLRSALGRVPATLPVFHPHDARIQFDVSGFNGPAPVEQTAAPCVFFSLTGSLYQLVELVFTV